MLPLSLVSGKKPTCLSGKKVLAVKKYIYIYVMIIYTAVYVCVLRLSGFAFAFTRHTYIQRLNTCV